MVFRHQIPQWTLAKDRRIRGLQGRGEHRERLQGEITSVGMVRLSHSSLGEHWVKGDLMLQVRIWAAESSMVEGRLRGGQESDGSAETEGNGSTKK